MAQAFFCDMHVGWTPYFRSSEYDLLNRVIWKDNPTQSTFRTYVCESIAGAIETLSMNKPVHIVCVKQGKDCSEENLQKLAEAMLKNPGKPWLAVVPALEGIAKPIFKAVGVQTRCRPYTTMLAA